MLSKLKTVNTVCIRLVQAAFVTFIFAIPILLIVNFFTLLNINRVFAITAIVFWICAVAGIAGTLPYTLCHSRALKNKQMRKWLNIWNEEIAAFPESVTEEWPEDEYRDRQYEENKSGDDTSKKYAGECKIEKYLKIVFVYYPKEEKHKHKNQFTIFCSPSYAYAAEKLGDLILADDFSIPTKYTFDLVVVDCDDPTWDLAALFDS